jgi:putative transposase
MEWFRNRLEGRVIIEDWRRHYNEIRPHSSLNYLTPQQFVGTLTNQLTTEAGTSSSYVSVRPVPPSVTIDVRSFFVNI